MPQVGFPYSDPGSFMGGIREQKAILNGLQADAFRSASQSQNTGQAARAFSGANVSNDNSQTASLSQVVTATNDQTLTISPVSSTISEGTKEVAQLTLTGVVGASAATALNTTGEFLNFEAGDQIRVTIQDIDGAGATGQATYTMLGGTDSIDSLINFINNDAAFAGVTASWDGTDSVLVTADTIGARNLVVQIDNAEDGGAITGGTLTSGAPTTPGAVAVAEIVPVALTNVVDGTTLLNDSGQFAYLEAGDTMTITVADGNGAGSSETLVWTLGAGETVADLATAIAGMADVGAAAWDATEDSILVTAQLVGDVALVVTIGNLVEDTPPSITGGARTTTELTPGAAAGQGNFDHNYLQRYIAGADAADYLSRGAANIAQSQGTDQSAFAKLFDFDATTDSNADNKLVQDADVNQQFLVELTATVSNKTNGTDDGHAYNAARFREIGVDLQDQSAQAIFTSGQRQGSADQAMSMIAVSDGADADNSLTQTASIVQTGNVVELLGKFDLSVSESNTLSPRSTDLLVNVNANGGISSAINSSSACQEQALVQSAAGGVDEAGNQTENAGTASNLANSSLENNESTTVLNSITILV